MPLFNLLVFSQSLRWLATDDIHVRYIFRLLFMVFSVFFFIFIWNWDSTHQLEIKLCVNNKCMWYYTYRMVNTERLNEWRINEKRKEKKKKNQKTEEDKLSGQLSSLGIHWRYLFFFSNTSNFGIQALAKSQKGKDRSAVWFRSNNNDEWYSHLTGKIENRLSAISLVK